MPPKSNDVLDVLIVGAGFSGLSAGRFLSGVDDNKGVAKCNFKIVDSFTDHVGGRAYSFKSPVPPTVGWDHGAQYIGDTQNTIMSWAKKLLKPEEIVNGTSITWMHPQDVSILAGDRFSFPYKQNWLVPDIPDLSLLQNLQLYALIAYMVFIETQIDVMEPWNGPKWLLDLDKVDMQSWIDSKSWLTSKYVKDMVAMGTQALLSADPAELSPYYYLWYCACNDGFLTEVNDEEGGPQQYWFLNGTNQLADKFAEPFKDRIQQGVFVTGVDLTGDVVKVTYKDGTVQLAKKVLLCVSPHTIGKFISFNPQPSPERSTLFNQRMGRTLKCQVFYKTAWWHSVTEKDSTGKPIIVDYKGFIGGGRTPVMWCMDNSPPSGKGPYCLMTFTTTDFQEKLGPNPSKELVAKTVTDALQFAFGDNRALYTSEQFLDISYYVWCPQEAHVGGGPNTFFAPGVLTSDAAKVMNEPWDNKVFFASTENSINPHPTSESNKYNFFATTNEPQYDPETKVLLPTSVPPFTSKYSDKRKDLGYMDGALLSGEYGAVTVLAALKGAVKAPVKKAAATEKATAAPQPEEKPLSPTEIFTILQKLAEVIANQKKSSEPFVKVIFSAVASICPYKDEPSFIFAYVHNFFVGLIQVLTDTTSNPLVKAIKELLKQVDTFAPKFARPKAPAAARATVDESPRKKTRA